MRWLAVTSLVALTGCRVIVGIDEATPASDAAMPPPIDADIVDAVDIDASSACAVNPCGGGVCSELPSGDATCTLSVAVAALDDDALEDPGGTMLPNLQFFSFNTSGHFGGMRFSLGIPSGSTITAASIDVYVDSAAEDDPNDSWFGEAVDDAPPFTAIAFDVSTRTRTVASMVWNDTGLGEGITTSPSLVAPLAEVIGRPGWQQDNHFGLIAVEGGVDIIFEWRSRDHSGGAFVPTLNIEFTPP